MPYPAQGSLIRGRGCPTGFNDLQNFVFLGASGRLGAACDWVWFNVPQGPQKQIECFLHAYRAWRAGKGKARTAAHRQSCHCCIPGRIGRLLCPQAWFHDHGSLSISILFAIFLPARHAWHASKGKARPTKS